MRNRVISINAVTSDVKCDHHMCLFDIVRQRKRKRQMKLKCQDVLLCYVVFFIYEN